MKNIIMREMLWHLISHDLAMEIVEQDLATMSQQWLRALAIIDLLMKDEVIPHIFHFNHLEEVWIALKDLYKLVKTTQWFLLKNEFYKLNMQEPSSMLDFLFTVKDLLGLITRVGDVNDEDVVLMILNAFLESYESFVQGVSTQVTLPNFDQLSSRLMQEA